MTLFQSTIYGLVQGLTEFIPISSSAHLALLSYFFHWQLPQEYDFIFKVLLQFATLGAVLVYFAKDIWQLIIAVWNSIKNPNRLQDSNFLIAISIVCGTLPLVLVGLPLKKLVAESFNNPFFIAIALLFTAVLMWVAERSKKSVKADSRIGIKEAVIIGFFQLLAIFPGVSRSGATISAGLLQHTDRPQSTRFSFLLSIPALTGAGLMSILDLIHLPNSLNTLHILIPGLLTSFFIGLVSIHWLVKYVQRHSLTIFSIYCVLISLLTFGKILFS